MQGQGFPGIAIQLIFHLPHLSIVLAKQSDPSIPPPSEHFQCFYILASTCYCQSLFILLNGYEIACHCGFNYISLITSAYDFILQSWFQL
jgi:hypothetical protein